MTLNRSKRRGPLVALFLLLAAHLALVLDIAKEPLNLPVAPPSARAVVWPLFRDAIHCMGPGADFFALYHAGHNIGAHQSPYQDPEPTPRTPYFYPYRYLPGPAKTLGAALSTLSPLTAYRLWLVLTELVLVGVGAALYLANRQQPTTRYLPALLLLSTPYFLELYMGQFTFVAMALLTVALVVADLDTPSRGLTALGALAFALSAELKVFPWVAAPALLLSRRGRWALAAGAGTFAVLDLPSFLADHRLFQQFLSANFLTAFVGLDSGNHGLLYLLYRILQNTGVAWTEERWSIFSRIWQLSLLAGTASLVLLKRSRPLVGGAVLALAHMLSYVHVWEHHYSGGLVLSAALVMYLVAANPTNRRMRWLLGLCLLVLALPTTYFWQDRLKDPFGDPSLGWSKWEFVIPPLCKVLPTLAIFGAGVWSQLRQQRKLATRSHATSADSIGPPAVGNNPDH